MEFVESTESTENYDYLSSSIKQLKNYLLANLNTFLAFFQSKITSVLNSTNSTFSFLALWVLKHENAESTESFRKFDVL